MMNHWRQTTLSQILSTCKWFCFINNFNLRHWIFAKFDGAWAGKLKNFKLLTHKFVHFFH